MYDLGIIGGMGPLATQEIYKRIIEKTLVKTDQDQPTIVILNKSTIPDRSQAILFNGESPVASLNECIQELVGLDVKNFIIACNTAHYFINQLKIPQSIKFISLIDQVLIKVLEKYPNKPIYILGTTGTIKANIYRDNKYARNLDIRYLNEQFQEVLMSYIYDIKENSTFNNLQELENILNAIKTGEPNAIFLVACTELSIASKFLSERESIIDAVDTLVEAVIRIIGYRIKD